MAIVRIALYRSKNKHNRSTMNAHAVTLHNKTSATPFIRKRINSSLQDIISMAPNSLREPMSIHFHNSGKCLRGLLAYGACTSLGQSKDHALKWALVVELVHNASLVHDDVCDRDGYRRGSESVFKKFGEAVAICLGDYLLSQAYLLAAQLSTHAVSIVAKNVCRLSSGQASEFMQTGYPDWNNYSKIACNKTSPALLMAVEGAMSLACEPINPKTLNTYFDNASICFQIINDLKNFAGLDGAANPCSDLANCRPNAVIACFKSSLPVKDAARFDIWADRIRSGDLIADTTETRYWWQRVKDSLAFSCVEEQLDKSFTLANAVLSQISPHVTGDLMAFHHWLEKEMAYARSELSF